MSQINPVPAAALATYSNTSDEQNTTDGSFNDKVLDFFKQNQPEGSLNEVIAQLKKLAVPGEKISMQQLNSAILIADGTLRKDEEYKTYTDSTLDRMTTQMLGVNMFYNNMLYKSFTKTDDDTSL
ncbi:type III secretion system protein [Pantoea ananatis]|uniref:type III secretion system protein n=1 Tax=Pantoea ananas TaxID=553 RepID=UPI00158E4B4D|nr:type III secretion system protein [Pantoea ananatis]MBA4823734.1 type III secretion system protein [Pantoea ananatis]QKV85979.1 type III secretion system protein [Pantoea ananatis]